jgi:hypothetical protein
MLSESTVLRCRAVNRLLPINYPSCARGACFTQGGTEPVLTAKLYVFLPPHVPLLRQSSSEAGAQGTTTHGRLSNIE